MKEVFIDADLAKEVIEYWGQHRLKPMEELVFYEFRKLTEQNFVSDVYNSDSKGESND